AQSGLGIACLPREFVKKELEEGSLIEVKTEPCMPTRALGLVIPDNNDLNFCTREFINLIR
ncbi:MAG: LysR family transcriptional regulator, partial [Clostridia bacterium]|nr:LysR family transcriptional regulator [Clostridia bacterium]